MIDAVIKLLWQSSQPLICCNFFLTKKRMPTKHSYKRVNNKLQSYHHRVEALPLSQGRYEGVVKVFARTTTCSYGEALES